MEGVFRKVIAIIISTAASTVYSSKTITFVPVGENVNDVAFDTVLHILMREFGVRVKYLPTFSDRCEIYKQLSRKYVPVPGQSMLFFISVDETRPTCKEDGGNVLVVRMYNISDSHAVHLFKYGEMKKNKESDVIGTTYDIIEHLHRVTTVSSDLFVPHYETGLLKVGKVKSGIPIPGYLALAFSLGTVLAFAILVRVWVNYRKKSTKFPVKSIDVTSSRKTSKRRKDERFGSRPEKRKKRKERNTSKKQLNELPSEPWTDFSKGMSKETWEELASVISRRRNLEEVLENPVNASEFLFYLHRLTRLAIEYFDDPSAFNVTADLSPGFLYRTMPRFAPANPEPFTAICEDLKRKILPGDAFYDELNALMFKIPSQQVVIVGIDANAKMGLEQQSDVLGKWYYPAERTSDNEQHKRKMRTLQLQLDYVLTRNIPQSDIRKSRAVWDVAFDSDHHPVLLSLKIRFHKRNRGVFLQPKIDMAGLKDDECKTNFRQRRCKRNAPGVLSRKKFAFASTETKFIESVARSTGDFNQEMRLRRKLCRQLQQRDNEWTSRAKKFEKAWKDKNSHKAYASLKQYGAKMKRCSSVFNTANGVAVGEATLPV
ncbi:hypothetical protein RB195_009878 [Necator americanus]|uniref:Uncharacterized protein n=1 Tax=Necator americanus TaxID=51031 RepID=A0ABR1CVE0_NECAM